MSQPDGIWGRTYRCTPCAAGPFTAGESWKHDQRHHPEALASPDVCYCPQHADEARLDKTLTAVAPSWQQDPATRRSGAGSADQ